MTRLDKLKIEEMREDSANELRELIADMERPIGRCHCVICERSISDARAMLARLEVIVLRDRLRVRR